MLLRQTKLNRKTELFRAIDTAIENFGCFKKKVLQFWINKQDLSRYKLNQDYTALRKDRERVATEVDLTIKRKLAACSYCRVRLMGRLSSRAESRAIYSLKELQMVKICTVRHTENESAEKVTSS